MYRIGFGSSTGSPYLVTPNNYFIRINREGNAAHSYKQCNPTMFERLREFTVKDIDFINDFEFTENEEAKEHVRKAVEQCI